MNNTDQQLQELRLKALIDSCRDKKLKITPQRLEIFRELVFFDGHPSADEIFARIRERMPTMSVDTVYRTLAMLQQAGVLAKVEVLDDLGRFDMNLDPHHHFVCTRCHKVEDFYWPDFDGMAIPEEVRQWGEINRPHVEVRGICRACLRAS